MKTNYINTLSEEVQSQIKVDLQSLELDNSDIERAMNSRLCDLEDTIDINKYLWQEVLNEYSWTLWTAYNRIQVPISPFGNTT